MVFKTKTDIYETDQATGQRSLVKKGLITNIDIPIEEIYAVENAYNTKGKILKNSCRVFMRNDIREVVIMKSFEGMEKIRRKKGDERIVVRGFIRYDSK